MNVDRGHPTEIDDEEEDLSALDTLEFAGVLESGEFEAAVPARARDPLRAGDLAFADSQPHALVSGEVVTAITLLPDTGVAMGVLDAAAVGVHSTAAMLLYGRLRTLCSQEFLAVATQMTTRSGRVVVSSITAADRRQRLSEFASSSILALEHLALDKQYLLAEVGEFTVWVFAVDETRLFAALLPSEPVAADLLAASAAALDEFRRGSS